MLAARQLLAGIRLGVGVVAVDTDVRAAAERDPLRHDVRVVLSHLNGAHRDAPACVRGVDTADGA